MLGLCLGDVIKTILVALSAAAVVIAVGVFARPAVPQAKLSGDLLTGAGMPQAVAPPALLFVAQR
jgi:hypothetical protein